MKVDFFSAVILVFVVGVCLTAIDFKRLLIREDAGEVVASESPLTGDARKETTVNQNAP